MRCVDISAVLRWRLAWCGVERAHASVPVADVHLHKSVARFVSDSWVSCNQEMSTMRATEHDKYLYELSQRRYAVCLLPFRAEPRGFLGCKAHSCGIPTLVSSHAALAPLLSRLVNEPDYFIGMSVILVLLCICVFVFLVLVTCKRYHHPSSTMRHWVLWLCLCLFYAYFNVL